MSRATIWSLSAAFGSLLVGGLLVYIFRKISSHSHPATEPLIEKSPHPDDSTFSHNYTAGSPLPSIATATDPDSIDRGQWVLRLTRHVFSHRHESKYNVVVINKELEYHFSAEGIVERHEVNYYEPPNGRKVPYDVVVFQEGVLYNMGDGGDINWDWMGNFKRSGTSMLTFKACEREATYSQDPWLAIVEEVEQARHQVHG